MDLQQSGSVDSKRSTLQEFIDRDPLAVDLRISLFVSAARSFKYDTCLQPFPPDYFSNKEKNIDELNRVLDGLQSLKDIKVATLPDQQLHLLHWIVYKQSNPGLRTVPKAEFDAVLEKAPSCLPTFQRPQHIFEVVYRDDAHSERRFRDNLDQFRSHYAYHGSKLFNFYSILNYGLQQHLNKTALFGEGIYLSAELHVSQMFAPTGAGWARSALGSHLACTALCEYIDIPSYVKCQEENSSSDIPEKYILVKNNDLVQVRYLLVYGSKRNVGLAPVSGQFEQRQRLGQPRVEVRERPSRCMQWLAANKSWLMAGGYFLMLFAIGLMNNPNAHYVKQMFLQKINHVCNALFGGVADRDA